MDTQKAIEYLAQMGRLFLGVLVLIMSVPEIFFQ